MGGRAFFDTNVLIYSYADSESVKQEISRNAINNASDCIVSTQILNEINNVMTRKWRMPYEAIKAVQTDIRFICKLVYITEDIIDKAIGLHFRYGFSYFDCLMLSSALDSDCEIIYTEDMNNGQVIDEKLKIINPFADLR